MAKAPEWLSSILILAGGLTWIGLLFLLACWIGGVPLFN